MEKVIKNKVIVKVEENMYILINTLYGNINIINKVEKILLENWDIEKNITTENSLEKNFRDELYNNKYIVASDEEENKIERNILVNCQESFKTRSKNITDIVFVLTYECNFACPYCYEKASSYNNNKILTKQMVDTILSLHDNKIDNITLYGGEPLLDKTEDIINYIISKCSDSKYYIITNGYNIDKYIELLKTIEIGYIMITLDGDEKTHNKTRKLKNGGKTYEKIISNIDLCLANDIPVKIRMNLSDNNLEICKKLRDNLIKKYYDKYKQKKLAFELQTIFQLDKDKKYKINKDILFKSGQNDINMPHYNVISKTVSYPLQNFVDNRVKRFYPKISNCEAEGYRLFYDSEGMIYSCILSVRNKCAAIGTYYPYVTYKEKSIFTRTIFKIEKCRECKLKFLCGGGCGKENYDESKDIFEPNCKRIEREIYYELPELIRERIKNGKQENISIN